MGGGIAMSFADHGIPVKITRCDEGGARPRHARIRDNYAVSVKRGSLTQEEMEKRLARIQPVPALRRDRRLRRGDRGGVRADG
jgi:3-hydroxyacyl-CoA dehydrogenase